MKCADEDTWIMYVRDGSILVSSCRSRYVRWCSRRRLLVLWRIRRSRMSVMSSRRVGDTSNMDDRVRRLRKLRSVIMSDRLFPNTSNHNWSVDARISLNVSLTDQVLSWTWLWARRKLSRIRSWRVWQRSWFWWSWWNCMIELIKIRFSRTALRRMDLSVVNYATRRHI